MSSGIVQHKDTFDKLACWCCCFLLVFLLNRISMGSIVCLIACLALQQRGHCNPAPKQYSEAYLAKPMENLDSSSPEFIVLLTKHNVCFRGLALVLLPPYVHERDIDWNPSAALFVPKELPEVVQLPRGCDLLFFFAALRLRQEACSLTCHRTPHQLTRSRTEGA